MSFSLSSESQRLLEERVECGQFATTDEAIQAALHALDELDAMSLTEEDFDAIDRAEDQIERGEVYDLDEVRARFEARFGGK